MGPRSQPGTIGRDRALCQHRERVATLIYSQIESAKLAGVEPRAYLGEAESQGCWNLTARARRWEDDEGLLNRQMAPIPGTAEVGRRLLIAMLLGVE